MKRGTAYSGDTKLDPNQHLFNSNLNKIYTNTGFAAKEQIAG